MLDAYLKNNRISYTEFGRKIGVEGKNPGRTIERIAKGQNGTSLARAKRIIEETGGKVTLASLIAGAAAADSDPPGDPHHNTPDAQVR